ncbi:hypothetical protein J6590_021298 [Homalodisca vitripennis]|nr:hypothetical protein J6590_021298 [Homalodisca vitripennis]
MGLLISHHRQRDFAHTTDGLFTAPKLIAPKIIGLIELAECAQHRHDRISNPNAPEITPPTHL